MSDPGVYCGIDLIGGGTGAIDKINGSVLNDKDIFLTVKDGKLYPHWLDDDSGAGESSPTTISPDLNAGTKRWLLAEGVFAGLTLYGNIVIPDDGYIGSVSDPDAIQIEADGDVVLTQDLAITGSLTMTGNIIIPDGGTVGQDAGPLLTFNDTDNRLQLTGGAFRAGSGILFGSDTAAANTLDDYEEGTWTAELRGSTARANTPVIVTGFYTKIGRKVTCIVYFNNVDTTGAIGGMQVTGFPFTSLNEAACRGAATVAVYGLDVPNLYLVGDLPPNSSTMTFLSPADDAAWGTSQITAGAGKFMELTCTYFTAA